MDELAAPFCVAVGQKAVGALSDPCRDDFVEFYTAQSLKTSREHFQSLRFAESTEAL